MTDDLKVDVPAVERLVRDAIAGGIQGVFLAGTCGEGPWLQDRERSRLVAAPVAAAQVRRGLFSSTASFLGYPLTPECQVLIESYARS